jgi:hypothetical protein
MNSRTLRATGLVLSGIAMFAVVAFTLAHAKHHTSVPVLHPVDQPRCFPVNTHNTGGFPLCPDSLENRMRDI